MRTASLLTTAALPLIAGLSIAISAPETSVAQHALASVGVPDYPLEGVTRPHRELEIGFMVAGRVSKVEVQPGDRVEAGQVLARLDASEATHQAELARLLAQSTLEIDAAEAEWELSKNEESRIADALSRDAASDFELADARLATTRNLMSLKLFRQRHREAQIRLDLAETSLDQHVLRAPIGGIIADLEIDVGEIVERQAPVLRLVCIEHLEVDVWAPIASTLALSVGDDAQLEFPAAPALDTLAGRVTYLAPTGDGGSDTRMVRVRVENPEATPAGLRAAVRFSPQRPDAAASDINAASPTEYPPSARHAPSGSSSPISPTSDHLDGAPAS